MGITAAVLCLFAETSCRTEEGELLKDVNKASLAELRDKYAQPGNLGSALNDAHSSPEARNRVLNDLILIVDLNYYHQEKLLYDKKGAADFLGDTAVLGLNTAGTLNPSVQTLQILHAISAGITGTRSAFDSDVLQKQAIPAVIAKMRALRAERMKFLRGGMMIRVYDDTEHKVWHYIPRPLNQYSIEQGLYDLVAYYNAGTFVGAIQGIQADAGVQKKNAEDSTPSAPTPTPAPSPKPGT